LTESYILISLSFVLFLAQATLFLNTRRLLVHLQKGREGHFCLQEQTLRRLEERIKAVRQANAELRAQLVTCVRRPALLRFSAFDDVGSDLSFSLALLDQNGDGVVLSSLYGREESRLFAKPVRRGTSSYRLSSEEERAIALAMQKGETAGRDGPHVQGS
jgi:hypothetical protein